MHTVNNKLLESQEREMPFSADREKKTDHKEGIGPYLAPELHLSDL